MYVIVCGFGALLSSSLRVKLNWIELFFFLSVYVIVCGFRALLSSCLRVQLTDLIHYFAWF